MVGEGRVKNHGKRIMALPAAISKIESSKNQVVAKNVKNKMDIKGEFYGPQAYYGFYRFIGSHYKLRPHAMFRVSTKDHNHYLLPMVIPLHTRSASEPRAHAKEPPSEAEPQNLYHT